MHASRRFEATVALLTVFGCAEVAGNSASVVSGLSVDSARSYELVPLETGAEVYTDRRYTVTELPEALAGALLLKTPNDDKWSEQPNLITLTLGADADVFVAYDVRGSTTPVWLDDWQETPDTLRTTDVARRVFVRSARAGDTLVLGGNVHRGGDGAESHFNVIVQPRERAPAPR